MDKRSGHVHVKDIHWIDVKHGYNVTRFELHGQNTRGGDVTVIIGIPDDEHFYFGYLVETFRDAWRTRRQRLLDSLGRTTSKVENL